MAAEGIEYCLVVPRIELFGSREENVFSGFIAHDAWNVDLDAMVQKHGQYLPRRAHQGYLGAEEDPTQKQIIPVGIFRFGDQVFAYQRLQGSSEERLHGWQQVLIGGHIDPGDLQAPDLEHARVDAVLERALRREFHEEINYRGF